METVKAIIDLILVITKLLGQIPALYDNFKKYEQDVTYQTTSSKLDAAFKDFIKAKNDENIQAQLNAAHTIATGGH
jgi:hypothetical protein